MKVVSLNGTWKCKPDFDDIGIEKGWYLIENYSNNGNSLIDIQIPNSFNLLKNFEVFEGIFWHFYQFNMNESVDINNHIYQIRFKGSNYKTQVWLNGAFLGEHNGGFTPFYVNISKHLTQKDNFLVIRVDNVRKKDRIPPIFFDWFNWGGIYRDVDLLLLNKNRIKEIVIKTTLDTLNVCNIKIIYKIIGFLSFKWQILDSNHSNTLYEGDIFKGSGLGNIILKMSNPKLWSPDNPYLYYLKIINISSEIKEDILYESYFGVRQVEVIGSNILLNKRKIRLKGVSLHEEYMPFGRTIPYEKRLEDIKTIKSLGFNALRTAHYSHDEDLLEIADKIGILILEEIPVYWNCNFKSNAVFKVAARILRELIKRDINHPSVIWWSVGNEIPIHKRECSRFVRRLMMLARTYDDTRIVTYVSRKLITDLTRRFADVATINTYFGWYFGHERMLSLFLDIMNAPFFTKPWIFTEFGAGAKYGFHDDWRNQTKFTEERQLQLLDYTIRTINSKEYFAGWLIWIFRDFRSLMKSGEYQQGFNRKGIVSEKSYEKKLIFYRIPKLIENQRKALNTKVLGIILWIIFFPFSYLVLTHLITILSDLHGKIGFKKGATSYNYSNEK
ncbi:MAG: glycoside hydrolase family 2 protein [Candidatus Odinarchaeota archaeon]